MVPAVSLESGFAEVGAGAWLVGHAQPAACFGEAVRRRRKGWVVRDRGRLDAFLEGIIESGESSWMLLQNVHMPGVSQPMSLALALAQSLLKGRGAWRVHGGGFAGTTLNFVPQELVPAFAATMENSFGADCCFILDVRPEGPALVCKQLR